MIVIPTGTNNYTCYLLGRNQMVFDFRRTTRLLTSYLSLTISKYSISSGTLMSTDTVQLSLVPVTVTEGSEYSYAADLSGLASVSGPFLYKIIGVMHHGDNDGVTVTAVVLNGGVSKADFYDSYLQQHFLDLPDTANWIFTTRGNGLSPWIYKSEITEFYFATTKTVSGTNFFLIEDGSNPNPNVAGVVTTVFTSGDFKLLKAELTYGGSYLSSVRIGYYTGGPAMHLYSSVTFTLHGDPKVDEKYVIYFRNSLGFLEALLCWGQADKVDEFTPGTVYQTMESAALSRGKYREKLTVRTGYSNRDRLLFIRDMLISDECYLVYDNQMRRCQVTSDDWTLTGDRKPGSVTLNIDLMNDEHSVSPVSVGDLLVSENMETIITENTPALVAIEEE